MDVDTLVDRFVAKVNAGYRDPIAISIYATPPSVLVGEPDCGFYDWMIKPYASVDWVDPLEWKLGRRFPAAYRSLVTRYIFPGFDAGGIYFFGNTPEGTDWSELRERIWCDRYLYEILLPGGFIEFGKRDMANYDPVCFDMNRESDSDCPVVQIDHEGVFVGEIDVVRQIAPSFSDVLLTVTADQ